MLSKAEAVKIGLSFLGAGALIAATLHLEPKENAAPDAKNAVTLFPPTL